MFIRTAPLHGVVFCKVPFVDAYLKYKLVIIMYHLMKHKILKNLYHEKYTCRLMFCGNS